MDGISLYQNQITQSGHHNQGIASENVKQSQYTSGVRQELTQLAKGTVFEGVITEVKDDYVTLGLTNGQSIKAQLEPGVNVRVGTPVLFEVKSNQNNQILLRQLPIQSQFNPTLQKALTTAGLPLTERNLAMVNAMMQKQMPIDKGSLMTMLRTLQSQPQASVETLVQMKKLGFSINETSIQQFESYKEGNHALVDRFSQMMEQVSEIFGNQSEVGSVISTEKMIALQNGILESLELGKESALETAQTIDELQGMTVQEEQMLEQPILSQERQSVEQQGYNTQIEIEQMVAQDGQVSGQDGQIAGLDTVSQNQTTGPLGEILTSEGRESLAEQLRQLPGMEENVKLFSQGELNQNLSAKELLQEIQHSLEQLGTKDASALKELFQGKEYKSLLKQAISDQWLLEPGQVANKENIEQLYERINRQMEKLEQFLHNVGKDTPALDKNISQVRGNLEMMNQINQLYNYVQLPLKLHNQNAHSDLYVYTNKKKLLDKDGELSALLHLELENLGTTDVQIKMLGSSVTTNFYLSDDISYKLIEQYVGDLQERLEEKGYRCNIHLENREKEVDFVQDFLEKELPVGKLQRYSFDVLT